MNRDIISGFIGTRLEALQVLSRRSRVIKIITVLNSRVLSHCIENNINYELVDKNNKNYIFNTIADLDVDLILSSGFPFILPKYAIDNSKVIVNSHPAFLPKYKGHNAIKDALAKGEKEIGVTLHYVDEKVDSGKIIFQKKINILDMSINKIYKKIFGELEPFVIDKGLELLMVNFNE